MTCLFSPCQGEEVTTSRPLIAELTSEGWSLVTDIYSDVSIAGNSSYDNSSAAIDGAYGNNYTAGNSSESSNMDDTSATGVSGYTYKQLSCEYSNQFID